MLALISRWVLENLVINLLESLAAYLPSAIAEWKRKKQREIEQQKSALKLEQELKKDLTPEERAKAYADHQNSGS